ncbi:MAG: hypothetical protein MUQ10_08215 [Anaerolineae bacterium]|nr:hypothetical protein [Anaerolineae bacterium]
MHRVHVVSAILLTAVFMVGDCLGVAPSFVDEFTVLENGWEEDNRNGFERGYDGGEYYIKLTSTDWFAWAYPPRKFEDAEIAVYASLASGSIDNHFGVVRRYASPGDFYYLAVSSDGYYGFVRRIDGGALECISDANGMLPLSESDGSDGVVRVSAICQGTELSLYLNDQWIVSVTDDNHSKGYVGVGAGSGATGDVRVNFDSFSVRVP